MADIALAPSPIATPLASWLASDDPQLKMVPYRGVLTPVALDERPAEIAALLQGAAVHDLGWLRRVQVKGGDRFRWLNGMVSNTVNDLAAQMGAWNLVLNAQGRIQGDLTVWRAAENPMDSNEVTPGGPNDTLELEIAADQLDRLLTHLDRFIIMDDVELSVREGETAIGLTGPDASAVLRRIGLKALPEPMTHSRIEFNGMSLRLRRDYGVLGERYEIWTPTGVLYKLWKFLITGGAVTVGSGAYEALRVADGIPTYGIDMVERDLPQETSQTRGLHFNKGCYQGQEIVERIRSRGSVHRHLRQIEIEGPVPASGTQLTIDGKEAGHVTSATEIPVAAGARRVGIAMVKAEAEVGNKTLQYATPEGEGTARLLAAPIAF